MAKARHHGWRAGPGGIYCIWDDNAPHYCNDFSFFIAKDSDFHPPELQEASEKINDILRKLPNAPDGRHLVLLGTSLQDADEGHGLLLAYAKPVEKAPPAANVGYDSDEEDIREAFGLPTRTAAKTR
jgi:hypothetical protein